jgi:hypothetical protein
LELSFYLILCMVVIYCLHTYVQLSSTYTLIESVLGPQEWQCSRQKDMQQDTSWPNVDRLSILLSFHNFRCHEVRRTYSACNHNGISPKFVKGIFHACSKGRLMTGWYQTNRTSIKPLPILWKPMQVGLNNAMIYAERYIYQKDWNTIFYICTPSRYSTNLSAAPQKKLSGSTVVLSSVKVTEILSSKCLAAYDKI